MHVETAENINTLGRFCGQRDVVSLDCNNLLERFGIEHADVMVLFGGSILAGGDVLAEAIRGRIASTYIGQDCVNVYHCRRRRSHNRDSQADRAVRISIDQDSRSDRGRNLSEISAGGLRIRGGFSGNKIHQLR